MRIIYPYNEILPKKCAHDTYIYHTCAHLAQGDTEVELLCGKGSLSPQELASHYNCAPNHNLKVTALAIVRKNNPLNVSWNLPFFYLSQKVIEKKRPDLVMLSVKKAGGYHLKRKVAGVKYLYEVHELAYYPGMPLREKEVALERQMLEQADYVSVTTEALATILKAPPYKITTPIRVIPLAVSTKPLAAPTPNSMLQLFYIGALYAGQGVDLLLHALAKTEGVHLSIVGGKESEISELKELAKRLGLSTRTSFLGFQKPAHLPAIIRQADGFVAPFTAEGKMSFVAHTKLFEYAHWQRPILAPDLNIVREHFGPHSGLLFFAAGNPKSLADAINQLQDPLLRKRSQTEISRLDQPFSWQKRVAKIKSFL